jgi:hypothetical protein
MRLFATKLYLKESKKMVLQPSYFPMQYIAATPMSIKEKCLPNVGKGT